MSKQARLIRNPKHATKITESGLVDLLGDGGVVLEVVDDKSLKEIFALEVDGVRTDYTLIEAITSNGTLSTTFVEKMRDWLYACSP